MFAKSFINDMFKVCKLYGPDAVLFMAYNDEARIPLGLAAANLQVVMLMHVECRVKLFVHDFVIGPQYKLIPSIYGICKITKTGDVSYSGDTFIRISSGKNDTSNIYTHAFNVQDIFQSKLVKRLLLLKLLMEMNGA